MNERRESLEAIFHAAMDLDSVAERERYLDKACSADPELRREVEELLRSAVAAEPVFQAGRDACQVTETFPTDNLAEKPGDWIGRYKLLEKIGEGGMGVVYMAEQREPVVRKVALKIIKLGMDTRQVVARFEAERQALALMDHPSIAQVLDGGATETGRPYFVMELVQGIPITRFCETNHLPLEARLKMFMLVCQAIQSAHQKGIIHRDLKPSNVLVTLHNGAPHPVVIDFGVAKATGQKLTEKTLFTNFATMIGTPAYMSPEQAELSRLDVDTRSDIYSLGVLLYELLTGTTPFPEERLRSVAYGEMQRIITEEEPEPPSTRLKRKTLTAASDQPTHVTFLATDLDWIVMKCLEKDRDRRYETISVLVSDIQAHMNDEPVIARPPSTLYRFQKFARRNQLQFAVALFALAVLLLAVAVSTWYAMQAIRAEKAQAHARALAESRLRTALRYTDRVSQDVAPPLWELIGAARISETLTTNTVALLEQLDAVNETDPEYRRILGQIYQRLGQLQSWPRGNSLWDPEAGLKASREAIRLLQPQHSERPSDAQLLHLVRAEQQAAVAAVFLQLYDQALSHYGEMERWAVLITNSASVGKEAERGYWGAQDGQGWALVRQRLFGEALTNYFMPQLRVWEETRIPENPDTFDYGRRSQTHKWMAICCLKLGRKEEALSHCQEALRFGAGMTNRRPNNAEYAGDQAILVAQLGESLLALYRPEGAQRLEDALAIFKTLRARDSSNTAFVLGHITVLQYSVSGLTLWALDPAATQTERSARLEQAQAQLANADKLINGLRAESARKAMQFGLEPARTNLIAAQIEILQKHSP